MLVNKAIINKIMAIIISIGIFTIASALIFSEFRNLPGYNLFRTPNPIEWFLFSTLAFLVGVTLPTRNNFSSMVVWLVYYMHIFPWIMLSPYYTGLRTNIDLTEKALYVILISIIFAIISNVTARIDFKIRLIKSNIRFLTIVYIIIIISLITILIVKIGVNFDIPKYNEIYQQRKVFKNIISSISGGTILSRLLLITTYTIIPFSLATSSYLIQIKRYRKVAIATIFIAFSAVFLVFSLAAFKSTIAVAALSFLIPILMHNFQGLAARPITKLFWLLALVGTGSMAVHLANPGSRWLLHYFRRTFIVPGMQVWFYIELFPCYSLKIVRDAPLIVSQVVYGTVGSANSGLIGSGFALGGAIGVLINMIIFGVWLIASKSYSRNIPSEILVPLAIIYGYLFANSAVTTVLFSYGAIFAPFLLAFLSSSFKYIR